MSTQSGLLLPFQCASVLPCSYGCWSFPGIVIISGPSYVVLCTGYTWLRMAMESCALSNKAYNWLRSSIFALMQQGTMGAWQPAISEAFFLLLFVSSTQMPAAGLHGSWRMWQT
jgi:hypothetical protein